WTVCVGVLGWLLATGCATAADSPKAGERYLRFRAHDTTSYGILEGDRVRRLSGELFGTFTKTEQTYRLEDVTVLTPTVPTHVLPLAINSRSHLGNGEIPAKYRVPQPFFKSPSCLVASGEAIVLPADSPGPVHSEAELVIVIGKKASKVPKERAMDYVFG